MENDRHIWRYWAKNLQLWGLTRWAAAILEAFGPLSVVMAQVIYIGQPLLSRSIPGEKLTGLAKMLEDSQATYTFIDFLRETDVP